MLAFLKSRDDVRIIGPDDASSRAATVSILPLGKKLADVAEVLAKEKLIVATGNFYGVGPLGAMHIDLDPGVLRMSFVHYNTMAQIEQLIAGFDPPPWLRSLWLSHDTSVTRSSQIKR